MITFNEDIVLDWENKTRIPLSGFLVDYYNWFDVSFPVLQSFYSGDIVELPAEHINKLNNLRQQYEDIEALIIDRKGSFDNISDSEIIDHLSDLNVNLLMASRLNKFLRSNIANSTYSRTYEFKSHLVQDSLEQMTKNLLDREDYQNFWTQIALRNDLQEFEYAPGSGNEIIISLLQDVGNSSITSIIDVISGDSVLGKDIAAKMTWDGNDLKSLGFQETFQQSVEILLSLKRGDIPEFIELGLSIMPGTSMKVFAFSPILRELSALFSSDDSIDQFLIRKIAISDGDIILEIEVSSRLRNITNKKITI